MPFGIQVYMNVWKFSHFLCINWRTFFSNLCHIWSNCDQYVHFNKKTKRRTIKITVMQCNFLSISLSPFFLPFSPLFTLLFLEPLSPFISLARLSPCPAAFSLFLFVQYLSCAFQLCPSNVSWIISFSLVNLCDSIWRMSNFLRSFPFCQFQAHIKRFAVR